MTGPAGRPAGRAASSKKNGSTNNTDAEEGAAPTSAKKRQTGNSPSPPRAARKKEAANAGTSASPAKPAAQGLRASLSERKRRSAELLLQNDPLGIEAGSSHAWTLPAETVFLYDEYPEDYPELVSGPELDASMRRRLTPERAVLRSLSGWVAGRKRALVTLDYDRRVAPFGAPALRPGRRAIRGPLPIHRLHEHPGGLRAVIGMQPPDWSFGGTMVGDGG